MSAIRAFLARAVPWPTAEQPGFVNIHWTNRDPATGAFRGLTGHAYTDHIAASNQVFGMTRNPVDLYVCMSLQGEAEDPSLTKSGKQRRRAMRSWDQALLLRSHWIDVDVKPGFFATTAEAMEAFKAWCAKVGMPEPTFIVMTGSGGFHAHWIYDEPVSREAWLPVAYAIQNALKIERFPCDYGVIVNPACILRIPGTQNHKLVPPGDVVLAQALPYTYPFAFIEQQMTPYKVAYALPVTTTVAGTALNFKPNPKLAHLPAGPRLDAGVEQWVPSLEEVADQCLFLKATMANHGAGYSEPLWAETLKIAAFCTEPLESAHELSYGHAGFDPTDTDAKFARISAVHGGGRIGWPQCRTINAAGATECTQCPHFVDNRSPLNYAVHIDPAAQQHNPAPGAMLFHRQNNITTALQAPVLRTANYGYMPPGFRHTGAGLIEWEVDREDAAGKPIKVWEMCVPMPLYDLDNYRKSMEGQGYAGISFTVQTDAINTDRVQLRLEDLADNRKIVAVCGSHSFAVSNPGAIRKMAVSFREQLWSRKKVAAETEGFGWSTDKGQSEPSGFCHGFIRYSAAGDGPYMPLDTRLAEQYSPVGSLAYWKQAASLITNQNRPDLNCVLAAAFASPLIKFAGMAGITLSVFSNASGVGKTHVMRISQSVWGDPSKGMGALDDTHNYVTHRVGVLRHLPFFYDELRQEEDAKKLVSMIFAMGQGKGKGRLTASAEAREVSAFSTMLIIASNSSLMSYINDHVKTTSAGVNRIFEVPIATVINPPGMIVQGEAQRINGGLSDNYGSAGAVYAQYLGHNVSKVKAAVAAVMDDFEAKLGATRDERFWVVTLATLVLGATYSNHLGLTTIDVAGMTAYLFERFKKNRSFRTGSTVDIDKPDNALRYVQDFFNVNTEKVLMTDRVWTQASRPPAHFAVVERAGRLMDKGIVVRLATGDAIIRISLAAFSTWLRKERGVQKDLVLTSLLQVPNTRRLKASLSSGTRHNQAREEVLELDLVNFPTMFD